MEFILICLIVMILQVSNFTLYYKKGWGRCLEDGETGILHFLVAYIKFLRPYLPELQLDLVKL